MTDFDTILNNPKLIVGRFESGNQCGMRQWKMEDERNGGESDS